MDMSDFLLSAIIGAAVALGGSHLLGLSGIKTKGNEGKGINGINLEQLMKQKENLEDFIAEHLAAG